MNEKYKQIKIFEYDFLKLLSEFPDKTKVKLSHLYLNASFFKHN